MSFFAEGSGAAATEAGSEPSPSAASAGFCFLGRPTRRFGFSATGTSPAAAGISRGAESLEATASAGAASPEGTAVCADMAWASAGSALGLRARATRRRGFCAPSRDASTPSEAAVPSATDASAAATLLERFVDLRAFGAIFAADAEAGSSEGFPAASPESLPSPESARAAAPEPSGAPSVSSACFFAVRRTRRLGAGFCSSAGSAETVFSSVM